MEGYKHDEIAELLEVDPEPRAQLTGRVCCCGSSRLLTRDRNMPDQFTNQLSAYLDGELDMYSRRRLGDSSRWLPGMLGAVGLRAIAAAAPHYEGREPPRDLWKDIEAR
jgi:hypothetical protein